MGSIKSGDATVPFVKPPQQTLLSWTDDTIDPHLSLNPHVLTSISHFCWWSSFALDAAKQWCAWVFCACEYYCGSVRRPFVFFSIYIILWSCCWNVVKQSALLQGLYNGLPQILCHGTSVCRALFRILIPIFLFTLGVSSVSVNLLNTVCKQIFRLQHLSVHTEGFQCFQTHTHTGVWC